MLRIAGYDDPALDRSSDPALCSALQLTNFWQESPDSLAARPPLRADSARDVGGARDEDLHARRLSPAWRAALSRAADTTRARFAEGRAVCDGVEGRLRWEPRLTWLGAIRSLDRLRVRRLRRLHAPPVALMARRAGGRVEAGQMEGEKGIVRIAYLFIADCRLAGLPI